MDPKYLEGKKGLSGALSLLAIILSLFLVVKGIQSMREPRLVMNSINISGKGEVISIPDVATFSLTVENTKSSVAEAQKASTQKINSVIDFLKKQGIEEKDIKTTNYSISPKYTWVSQRCDLGAYCPGGKNVIEGYTVSQGLEAKVRDLEKSGTILTGLGEMEVTNVYGPNFTVDQKDLLKDEARSKAIADAREKAKILSKELGVKLVRVISFYENDNGIFPYAAEGMGAGMDYAKTSSIAPTPTLPGGEFKVTSNVNISYEIK